jgi:hypothetical protein
MYPYLICSSDEEQSQPPPRPTKSTSRKRDIDDDAGDEVMSKRRCLVPKKEGEVEAETKLVVSIII